MHNTHSCGESITSLTASVPSLAVMALKLMWNRIGISEMPRFTIRMISSTNPSLSLTLVRRTSTSRVLAAAGRAEGIECQGVWVCVEDGWVWQWMCAEGTCLTDMYLMKFNTSKISHISRTWIDILYTSLETS